MRSWSIVLFPIPLAAALAGCGAPGSSIAPPVTATPAQSSVAGTRHAGSWMAAGLAGHDLLYVSNANGTVSVYRYWQRTLAGVLTSFSNPRGQCTDASGDVYITDSGKKKVYEYAHGGKRPIKVLDETPLLPYGCAVNPQNGDLAVANSASDEYHAGNIAVYSHASGTPTTYQGPYDDHFINCAYDNHGNLFTNSQVVYYYSFFYYIRFYFLPKHGTQLINEDLNEPYFSSGWPYVNSIDFDGKYWAVSAESELFLYTINILPQYQGKITFSSYNVGALAIYRKSLRGLGTQAVGAVDTRSASAVDYWKYPAGGSAIDSITQDLDAPVGIAISLRSTS